MQRLKSSSSKLAIRTAVCEILENRRLLTTVSAPYTPAEVRGAYGVNSIEFTYNGTTTSGSGAGETIAIFSGGGDGDDIASDANHFSSTYGLEQFNGTGEPTLTVVDGSGSTTDHAEECLDVEWAHAIAPMANIVVLEDSGDVGFSAAAAKAADLPGVSVVSISYSTSDTSSDTGSDSDYLTPSGHQGVTFLAATGDTASQLAYPALSPNVIGVGGTNVIINSNNTWDTENAWPDGGGGISGYEAQPYYQFGKVNGDSTTHKTDPDVSMDADSAVNVYDTQAGGWIGVDGTSLATPMWAGLIAIANQGRALRGAPTLSGSTQTLDYLYNLPSTDFHDITNGSNGHQAVTGYDMATGLGTPIANLLVPDLANMDETSLPSPWASADIGGPTVAGWAHGSGSSYTLGGSGSDIWGSSDQFQYMYEPITGNGTITAEVDTQDNTNQWAKAGVMFRNTLDADSEQAMTVVTPGEGTAFMYRTTTDGSSADTQTTGPVAPYWVRMTREGNIFTSYTSTNGTTWTEVGSETIAMNQTVYVGLADTSHDSTQDAIVQYSNVVVSVPSIATAASASPSPVTGKTVALSVAGADTPDPSEASSLTYNWVATSPAGSSVTFSGATNGTNTSSNITATVTGSGTYQFTVTVSDGLTTVTSSVSVTVISTLTSIAVSPASSTVPSGGTQQFTGVAYDQFGNAMATQPTLTWSIASNGPGSISTTGLYTAPSTGTGGTATVQASCGAITGTATVSVILSIINGTSGNDTIRLVRSGANLLVYVNNPVSPAYDVAYSSLGALTINGNGGSDSVNIDFSAGASPVPPGGITVDGGSGSGNDTLSVTGTTSSDTATVNANTITFNNSPITYTNIEAIVINGNGGTDSLTQTAQPGNSATLVFNGTTSGGPSVNDSLNVSGGTYTFAAPTGLFGSQLLPLAALTIGGGAAVTVNSASARWVLTLGSLTMANATASLALAGNDMIVHNVGSVTPAQSLANITAELATGFNGGVWNGSGISSTAACNDTTHLTALGVILNSSLTSFDNQPVTKTDVIVKYTYYGDSNLDGKVDGSDYSRIDYGFLTKATGWSNGDFNYDSVIDGSDYTLIDNAFNSQGAAKTAEIGAVATKALPARSVVPNQIFSTGELANTAVESTDQLLLASPDDLDQQAICKTLGY